MSDDWPRAVIGESTVADAIIDRLVHNAHRIELKGASMRKQRPPGPRNRRRRPSDEPGKLRSPTALSVCRAHEKGCLRFTCRPKGIQVVVGVASARIGQASPALIERVGRLHRYAPFGVVTWRSVRLRSEVITEHHEARWNSGVPTLRKCSDKVRIGVQ